MILVTEATVKNKLTLMYQTRQSLKGNNKKTKSLRPSRIVSGKNENYSPAIFCGKKAGIKIA